MWAFCLSVLWEDAKEDASQYDYYVCGLKINDEDYTVKSVIVTLPDGTKYYDHKLTNIEKGNLIDIINKKDPVSNPISSESSTESFDSSNVNDKRLLSILENNSSKVLSLEMGLFTSNHFVIVNNIGQGNISVVRAFDIEKQPKEIENEIVSLYRRNTSEGYSDVDRQNLEDIRRILGDDALNNIRAKLGEEVAGDVSDMGVRQKSERGADNALDSGAYVDGDIRFRDLQRENKRRNRWRR